jgi:hypothetical protein
MIDSFSIVLFFPGPASAAYDYTSVQRWCRCRREAVTTDTGDCYGKEAAAGDVRIFARNEKIHQRAMFRDLA